VAASNKLSSLPAGPLFFCCTRLHSPCIHPCTNLAPHPAAPSAYTRASPVAHRSMAPDQQQEQPLQALHCRQHIRSAEGLTASAACHLQPQALQQPQLVEAQQGCA
jgi:hypothetical protein